MKGSNFSEMFIEAHAGKIGDISIHGQESNYTTWRLAKMNLAIGGIGARAGHRDTIHSDCHSDLKTGLTVGFREWSFSWP